MKKIGLIINPIAGLGGTVGLKGTDDIYKEAIALGAKPKAIAKTRKVLELFNFNGEYIFYTASGDMGEKLLQEMGVNYECSYISQKETSCNDTIKCAELFLKKGVDLIVFSGGDGTARDIYNAIGKKIPVIGIPAGVKMQSAIFAKNPRKASNLINKFLINGIYLKECEVIDLDEELYRRGEIQVKLYGYLNVPYDKTLLQNKKSRTLSSERNNQKQIAYDICDNMHEDILYIIGPGSTTKAIMENLSLNNTLIGVDLIYNKKVIKNDVTEIEIIEEISKYKKVIIIITPIGGQGYIFGRGNQQISDKVLRNIRKENICIVATKMKLVGLKNEPLLMDTGSLEINEKFKGYYKVVTGYKERAIQKLSE